MTLVSTATRINGRDVDLSLGSVSDGKDAPAVLRPQALAVLKLFLAKPGGLVSKDELMAAVWPGIAVTDDSLVKCVTEIRRALGDNKHVIVKTVSKRGYVFEPGAEPASANKRNWLAFAAALISATVLAAVFLWPSQKPPMAQPAIAVLPFTNLSGDPAQDYFGQGLADDIITALSNFPTMRVMSRTSSFVYDKPVKVQQVAQELGVDYVLEGGVKNSAGKVRVTAQLINARTGEHIWASSFDEEGADPVALQEEIAGRINASIGGFGGEISRSEYAAAAAKPPIGLGEYDYYLRGHALWHRDEEGDNAKAREIWQAGLAKFPDSALLRIKVALSLYRDLVSDLSDDRIRDVDRGWKLLEEARADDNRTRLEELLLHWMSAWFYQFHDGNFERSIAEAEGAIKLAPYDALAYADLSNVLYNAGRTGRAVEWASEAVRRDPNGPDFYRGNLASAYYHAGKPTEALAELEKMREPWSYMRAAIYVRIGRVDEARAVILDYLKECPTCTVREEAVWPGGKQPQMVEHVLKPYLDDLRAAGLPE